LYNANLIQQAQLHSITVGLIQNEMILNHFHLVDALEIHQLKRFFITTSGNDISGTGT
jgi:hypothetical protein